METVAVQEHEFPTVLNEIVGTLLIETGKHVDTIINEVARHYGIEEVAVKRHLKSVNSPYTETHNRVVGYIDGKPIKRTTYHMSCMAIWKRLGQCMNKNPLFDSHNSNHVELLQEATYNYLK